MPNYPSTVKSKLPNVGTNIFTVMSGLANEQNAINLSQGFPDFAPNKKLIELVNKQMKSNNHQYAPMQGLPILRDRIAEKMESLYSANINPNSEITVTAGGTQAIYTAITALVHEDDEVIIFQPAYDCYSPAIMLAGGKPIFCDLELPDYNVNWDSVRKLINQRTKMIIINTPHNPTGTALNAFDMMQLQKLLDGTDIIVLSDEVYEHIIFDGLEHQSVLRFPKLAERSLVVYSFGKTYHNTGWKMGYCIGPENLMKEFNRVHQFLVFSVNTPLQQALAEYMNDKDAYLELNAFYGQKRDFFVNALKGSKFKIKKSQGTYFQLLDYSKLTDLEDTKFAEQLTIENKVASIPISVFYHRAVQNKMLRFCFAKSEETLEKAAEKLCSI